MMRPYQSVLIVLYHKTPNPSKRKRRKVIKRNQARKDRQRNPKKIKEKKRRRRWRRKEEKVEEEASAEVKGKKKKKSKKEKTKKEDEATPNVLLDFEDVEDETPSVPEPQPKTKEKKKPAPVEETKKDDMDSLDFWLSSSDAKVTEEKVETVTEPAAEVKETKVKKERKSKGEKRSSKSGKKSRKSDSAGTESIPSVGVAKSGVSATSELLELGLDEVSTSSTETGTTFKLLAEDENLKLSYDIKANPMYNNGITVAIVFNNKSSLQLTSLDFNVLDSLNAKLERPSGVSAQSSVPVPFQLPPGTANECQFMFTVQEFYMTQKLRGTVTYMMKSDSGTAQDKIDFKLTLSPSSFICPTKLPQDRFAALLSSGNLSETVSVKCNFTKTSTFFGSLSAIMTTLHLSIVEQSSDSASLYGCSIAGHHICILVKSQGDTKIAVSAKGSDSRLVSSLMDELKNVV
uniref:AP-3 complex subunit delta Mu C-terminal domain-containing protein n=1 Tax=Amphimedon queenslandica TaxID=400682 RepID=A0A1X7VV93_AMPQE